MIKKITMETKMIGNKIAEARKKATISQAQLAERLFVSPQAVGKWERGESLPDIITLNRLAEILGVDLNYFSENFQSPETVMAPVRFLENQPEELPSGKEKLSWDMSRGNWVDADFSGLKNLHEKFSSSNMQRCKFIGSDLSGLLLKTNNVDSCDFSGSDISNSHIRGSNLGHNLFKDCSLNETEFSGSNIDRCDFSNANLSGAKFSKSNIYGCDLTGVDFSGVVIRSGGFSGVAVKSGDLDKNTITDAVWNRTSFIDSQIADLVFTGSLDNCYFENCAFTRVTFQDATLRNTFFKNNQKLKRIRFTDCKADRITYEFLKQGKADLTGITLFEPELPHS
jgi:uncharacterized protein YjbI with pentapeptide repeats